MKQSFDDQLFNLIIYFLLTLIFIIVFYPLYFVVVASFSDPTYVNAGYFLLYPKGFTVIGYERVFSDNRIWTGYINTIIYTVLGTGLGLISTIMAGYALSRKDLVGRNVFMGLFVFTMYFSGGLIPLYMVVKGLNLENTRILMIILTSVSVYNIIIARSFFSSTIPVEIQEAAFIDGCGNARFFFSIVIPLSHAITAVIALYLAVGYWNAYFNAMIFLTDRELFPLQIYLREILLTAKTAEATPTTGQDAESIALMEKMVEVIKYGVIVISTLPILCMYPFLQKYFIKGVMIGAIKG